MRCWDVLVAATTSLMAAALSVARSCLAVVLVYGLCYIGIKVAYPVFFLSCNVIVSLTTVPLVMHRRLSYAL